MLDDSLPWKQKSLGIPLHENKKYQMSISCVLIDMKFISKLFSILLMETLLVSDPRPANLYKHIYSLLYKNYLQNEETEIQKRVWWYAFPTFRTFSNFRFSDMKIIFVNVDSMMFLYFRSILVIIGRSTGPDVDKNSEVPQMIQQVLQ